MKEIARQIALDVQNGQYRLIETRYGYRRAADLVYVISEACCALGLNMPPCQVPLVVRPINRPDHTVCLLMPPGCSSMEDLRQFPVIVISTHSHKVIGVDDDGHFLLENIGASS